jgi:hypothetical protein
MKRTTILLARDDLTDYLSEDSPCAIYLRNYRARKEGGD